MRNQHDSVKLSSSSAVFNEGGSSLKFKKRFTLIELLVVIAIIAILAAMLLPSLGAAKELGKRMTCCANMKNMVVLENQYIDTYGYVIPHTNSFRPNPYYAGLAETGWQEAMRYEYDSNIGAAMNENTPIPAFMFCPNGIPVGSRYYLQTFYGGRNVNTMISGSAWHGIPIKAVKHPSVKMCVMDFSNNSSRYNGMIGKTYYVPGAGSFQNATVQGYISSGLSTFDDPRYLNDLQRGRHLKSVNLYYFDGHIGSMTSADACNYFYIKKSGIDNPFDTEK